MPTGASAASRFRIPKALLALEGGREGATAAFRELLGAGARDEWEAAIPLLTLHGVAPYALFLLSRGDLLGEVPAFFAAALRARHRESQIEHFHLLGESRRLAERFHAGGVRAVPFKGAALCTTLYERPGLRPMQDLDWLAHQALGACTFTWHSSRAAARGSSCTGTSPTSSCPPPRASKPCGPECESPRPPPACVSTSSRRCCTCACTPSSTGP